MSGRRTAGQDTAAEGAARGAWGLVSDRTFGALFWGKLLATAGVWMQSVAAVVVIYEHTRSATAVSLISIAISTPQLLLGPWSGAWADRNDPARQILWGRALCLLGATTLSGYFAVNGSDPEHLTAVVFVCSLVVGTGFVVGGPALQSLIPDLVRANELHTAMALNTAPLTTSRIAGPALGAFVLGTAGPAAAFGVSAATHAVFIVLLLLARLPHRVPAERTDQDSMRAGLAYLASHRRLVVMLVATACLGIGAEPSLTLAPALAESLGGAVELSGTLTLAFGVGALVGLAAAHVVRHRTSAAFAACTGLFLVAVGLGLVAVVGNAVLAALSLALSGAGFSAGMGGFSALLQEGTDRVFRGRVMAWWLFAFVGSRPLASAATGAVTDATSVQVAFAVSGGALLLAAVLIGLALRRGAGGSPPSPRSGHRRVRGRGSPSALGRV